jgi:Tfp pilus assembly protein PilN
MLIEINLLPQKERKKYQLLFVLIFLVLIFLIASVYYYFQIDSTKTNISSLEKQILVAKRIEENRNKQTNTIETNNSITQLKNAVDWANNYPIKTIPVMKYLVSLLPERGFIQTFSYTDAGTVSLSVQFDSAEDAAYFLESLNSSKWIEDANLSSLNANQTAETEAASTNADQSNSIVSSNTQESGGTSGATGENQSTSNSGSETNTGATVTTNSSNASNVVKQPSSSTVATNKTNSDYMPRYIGQFDIKLKTDAINGQMNLAKKDGTKEQGVTGS